MLITNETAASTVKNVANKILPDCDEVFFEVGYFYFSGFEQIYEQLKDKKIRILIGINYDQAISKIVTSNYAIKENYFSQLVKDINDTDIIDQSIGINSHNLFIEKLRNGSMEIRCQPEKKDHSKIFIFKYLKERSQGGLTPGIVLSGSSNFTKSGFLTNLENNYLFREPSAYKEHIDQFNKKWSTSVEIVNQNSFNDFEEKVVKKTWVNKTPSPYYLYIKMLDEYFKEKKGNDILMPKELTNGKLMNIKYQEDAIIKGIEIINKHQGVIVADVVGLGKSIIASAIAKNLGLTTLVICPPHLTDAWEEYMNLCQIPSNVISRGKISEAQKYLRSQREHLIIVDEAHVFRNDLTTDYTDLHKICKNNKVILLSATPFNNRPQDTFNMIKLFQIPTKSSIQTIENLSEEFKQLISEYNKLQELDPSVEKNLKDISEMKNNIANKVRSILSPLVIRRSRLDLENIERYSKDLKLQKIEFPKRNDPKLINYDLKDLANLYTETINTITPEKLKINSLIGARYKSTSYVKPKYIDEIAKRGGYEDTALLKKSLENIADFMKRLLVRRFESCIYSFMTTLTNILNSNINIKKYYENGYIPIFKEGTYPDIDDLMEENDILSFETFEDLPEIKKLKEKGMWLIAKEELEEKFYFDLKNDIQILSNLKYKWDQVISKNFVDPKFQKFLETIQSELKKDKNRKIIVFSEFADTADYLYQSILKNNLKVFKYTSLESSKKINKQIIKQNFDASADVQNNDYDILVATDAISEGFNLSRAGTIINYDIPYNPTRVIQRVGRINRINKKLFDELYIYNFFPTEEGEKEVRTKRISKLKISMFQALFGDDTKVLTKDEELESFFAEEFKKKDSEDLNPESYYENLIFNIRDYNIELIEKVRELENRCRILRRNKNELKNHVIVYAKKGNESIFKLMNEKFEIIQKSNLEYFKIFRAEENELSFKASENFDSKYKIILQSLFNKSFQTALDKGKKKSLDILKKSLEISDTKFHPYLKDLIKVIEDFDDLPGGYLKMIRSEIRENNVNEKLEKLIKIITPDYIEKSFIRAQKIDNDPEKIILSEEFENV